MSHTKTGLWVSAALLCAAPAWAQDAAPPITEADIVVIGHRENLLNIPGSGATIESEDLEASRVFSVNEALRQVAGVYPRDEEGLGLRPNIGVRGLAPTRSSEVLLLEDGLPLTYAPYGDNATYSHPPIRRFERIEVLKGASQIRFGPHTVGGVVNYISPRAPSEFGGSVFVAGGDNGYLEGSGSLGGEIAGFRTLGHVSATHFDGIRDNHDFAFQDYSLRVERTLSPDHEIIARIAVNREGSQVSYSGLTEAEFAADPFGNPFPNDRFNTQRYTGAVTHGWDVTQDLRLTTSAYSLYFDRDWWRQSSNSGQRPNDASDPACASMANLNTTCGNEGRLREYHQYGVETRLDWDTRLLGVDANVEAGLRWHTERQRRLQVNSDTPTGRSPGTSVNGGLREDNTRYADAWSGFIMTSLDYGRFAISPGVRVEAIAYERENRLTGLRGESQLTEIIPGLGATFELRDALVVYAGVHRGFSPPRVEDVIDNSGASVDLAAEESVSYELGVRGELNPGWDIDFNVFHMDFDNQIVPASVAGGVGATLTSAGETRHSGVELSTRISLRDMGWVEDDDFYVRAAATYLGEAAYVGDRLSSVAGFGAVSVSGNRLPYAPEWIASAALGYTRGDWLNLQAEVQHTGEMFTDDLNTVAPTANGQRGLIDSATILNLAANLTPGGGSATFFVTVKNVTDEVFIVDRSRGILPGAPRLWQAGVSVKF
ncbi:MAG: TonB-dependent receptor plug domain-containing protein [Hyphomonadaceae bacterium]|nr:TonB-dependent receptor plug domain-containing protein [Hyphomonadaceae bacterium]